MNNQSILLIHIGQLNKDRCRYWYWKGNWMQLSFVRWEDHNEDGVVEVVTWDKNNIKEDGKRIVRRHMENRGCWFKVDMLDSRVFWEQDMALLGMIERRLYSKPYFTCALQIMSLFFIHFLGWNSFNFHN